MKHAMLFLTLFLAVGLATTGHARGPFDCLDAGFSQMYVFGDSDCDVGNYVIVANTVEGLENTSPDPAIYDEHRATNGPVYPEVVASQLGLDGLVPSLEGGTNYAYNGAQVATEGNFASALTNASGPIDPVLQATHLHSIKTQLAIHGEPDPDGIYLIDGAANDILNVCFAHFYLPIYYPPLAIDWETARQRIVLAAEHQVANVRQITEDNSIPVVVITPHDTDLSPLFSDFFFGNAREICLLYNEALAAGLAELDDPDVILFDQYTFTGEIIGSFANGGESCSGSLFDLHPCETPCDNLFFDSIHRTAAAHQLIGTAITMAILDHKIESLVDNGSLRPWEAFPLQWLMAKALDNLKVRELKKVSRRMRTVAMIARVYCMTGRIDEADAKLLVTGAKGIKNQNWMCQ